MYFADRAETGHVATGTMVRGERNLRTLLDMRVARQLRWMHDTELPSSEASQVRQAK